MANSYSARWGMAPNGVPRPRSGSALGGRHSGRFEPRKRTEHVWEGWCKLGLWLVGIIIALVLAAYFFSGVASFLSTLNKGTLLISFLLLMILLTLWRIGDQMKRQ